MKKKQNNSDGPYFLKLILYVIVGSQWLWISTANNDIPLPVGFVVGLIFASHDHFKIDRKIEYAVLIVAALIAYWAQIGIYINL
jgi:hypothetical protein